MNVKIVKNVVHGAKMLAAGALHAFEDKVAEDLIERGLAVQAPAANPAAEPLRTDGPTIEDFVAAGYPPTAYPPRGYAEKPSPGLMAFKAGRPVSASAPPAPGAEDEGAGQTAAGGDASSAPASPDAAAPKGGKKK